MLEAKIIMGTLLVVILVLMLRITQINTIEIPYMGAMFIACVLLVILGCSALDIEKNKK